jgi:NAD-dependent DNA ligase
MQAVVDRGAVASRSVTRKTDLLVTGYQDLTKLATGQSKSAKLRRAEELRVEGREVEIITERDLVVLLQATDAASEAGPDRSVAGTPAA